MRKVPIEEQEWAKLALRTLSATETQLTSLSQTAIGSIDEWMNDSTMRHDMRLTIGRLQETHERASEQVGRISTVSAQEKIGKTVLRNTKFVRNNKSIFVRNNKFMASNTL